ncbi:MAG: hypothetical protein V1736_06835 [Pseudomonadota bacterium]
MLVFWAVFCVASGVTYFSMLAPYAALNTSQNPAQSCNTYFVTHPKLKADIDFQIKPLGALSVGDVRTGTIPSPLPSQKHYLKVYSSVLTAVFAKLRKMDAFGADEIAGLIITITIHRKDEFIAVLAGTDYVLLTMTADGIFFLRTWMGPAGQVLTVMAYHTKFHPCISLRACSEINRHFRRSDLGQICSIRDCKTRGACRTYDDLLRKVG